MADFKKIKAEYIRGGTSYRKLADKYGVSLSSVTRRASSEKWADLRKQSEYKTNTKIVESVASQDAKRAVSINSVADTLLARIEEGINNGLYIVDASSTRQIVSALKDLRDIKGLKSELDMQEQIARIDKLRKESVTEQTNNDIHVVIESNLDDYSI